MCFQSGRNVHSETTVSHSGSLEGFQNGWNRDSETTVSHFGSKYCSYTSRNAFAEGVGEGSHPKLQRVSSLVGLSTGFTMPPRLSARKRAADEPPDEVLRRYVCIYPSAGYRQLAGLDNIDFTQNYLRTFLRHNRAAVVESFEASWATMPTLQMADLHQHADFLRGYLDHGAETALRALQYDYEHGRNSDLETTVSHSGLE